MQEGQYEKALECYIEAQKICPPTRHADNYCKKSLHYKRLKHHNCACEVHAENKPNPVSKDAW